MSGRVSKQEPEAGRPSGAGVVIRVRTPDLCVHLSEEECRQLYVLLGADAPFVRNQLSVIRRGGSGAVLLSTPEERRQVLDAVDTGGRGPDALSGGLRALKAALDESASCQSLVAKRP